MVKHMDKTRFLVSCNVEKCSGPARPQHTLPGPAGDYEEDYHGRVKPACAGASGGLPGASLQPLHEL